MKKPKPVTYQQLIKRQKRLEIEIKNQRSKIDYLERKNEELYKSISLRDDLIKQHANLSDMEKLFLKTLRRVFTEK